MKELNGFGVCAFAVAVRLSLPLMLLLLSLMMNSCGHGSYLHNGSF